MKKIKEMWNTNRVVFVLICIIIICFIVMGVVAYNFFVATDTSTYGDRLKDIENVEVTEEDKKAIIDNLTGHEHIPATTVDVKGKIIYIRVTYQNDDLNRAKEVASTVLEVIKDELKSHYDIHFTLVQESTEEKEGFLIMGAKNIGRNNINWNNNTPYTIEEETEESSEGEE